MAFITNTSLDQSRIYDRNKTNITQDMMIDNGSVDPSIENNMNALAKAAQMTLKKRKAIPDFKTKNRSFLQLYKDLRKMGIKNNTFFLRLYDKSLQGVDPYFPKLPLEVQMKIILECMINPWYFLREICRIPEDGKPIEVGGGSPFLIDRNSVATWYLFLNGIDHYSSKPRQRGKTQDAISKQNYSYHFGTMSASFLFFNKDQGLSKTNLYRLKCQRDMMPPYMQMRVVYNDDGTVDKGVDNITTMRNPVTNNTIYVMPKATSKDSAIKLGRGATAAFHYYDEFDFIPFNMEIINAAAFSYSKSSQNAIKNASLHGRIFTSTPGDSDSRDGIAANKYIANMLVWRDEYLDLPINQLKSIVHSTGYNGIVFVEHTWRQLKLSMKWYEEQCRLVNYNEEVILREIDLQRISGSSNSPFKRSDLIYLNNHKREPINTIDYSKNLCPILIYEDLHREYPYILSVDPSDGLALDNNAFTLINPYTQCAAAEFKSPYISQTDMSRLVVKFMDDFCPKSMIVVEANKGRELINRLLETKYRYRLYYDIDKLNSKVVDSTDEYGALKRAAYERRAWGFDTTPSSRPKLFAVLENFVEEKKDKLYTKYIIDDILGLIRKTSGKIEAGSEKHDDNIMSYLIGLYIYYNATNLEEFGIIRGASAPTDDRPDKDPIKMKEKMKDLLLALPEEMQDLFKGFIQEKDPIQEAWNHEIRVQDEVNKNNPFEEDERNISVDSEIAIERQLDHDIFESNFDYNQGINIEDIID